MLHTRKFFLLRNLLFCSFLLLSFSVSHAAKPDSINVNGKLEDSFSREAIGGATLTFMRSDSSVVKIDSTLQEKNGNVGFLYYYTPKGRFFTKLPGAGNYLVKIVCEGYQTKIFHLDIPLRKYSKWVREWNQDFLLDKAHKIHEVQLGEAVVKATKIKMVLKGDTVVFNADAFQLSQGSMLEQLIKQLPGMELGDGGNITYNGNHVSSLLVNGKDFFKGNPKIALENLPAYMVDKVKVYRRNEGDNYLTRDSLQREKNKNFVVDVNLKRQYNQGWLANAEVAGGTKNRYLARVFALRFTDHSKFFVFGNMNNKNDTQAPGSEGNWHINWLPAGTLKVRMGGANFQWDDKTSKTNFYSDFIATHEFTDNEQIGSGVTYLSTGDTYNRSHSRQENTQTHISWSNYFEYPGKTTYLQFSPSVDYYHVKNNGSLRSASFNADPHDAYRSASLDSIFAPAGSTRLTRILINNLSNLSHTQSDEFKTSAYLNLSTKSPIFGNYLAFDISGDYDHKDEDIYSHYTLNQPQTSTVDFRNQYTSQPVRSYHYAAKVNYGWNFSRFPKLSFQLRYGYEQTYNHGQRDLYRLDSLQGWNKPEFHPLGALPSTTDSLHTALDWKNSYHTINRTNNHITQLTISQSIGKTIYLSFYFPLDFNYGSIRDDRNHQMREKTRHVATLSPRISFWQSCGDKNKISGYTGLSYNFDLTPPELSYLLDVVDDANPLVVQLGNTHLSNTSRHELRFNFYRAKTKHQRNFSINTNWNVTNNAVAQCMTYNRTTGVSTFQPRNIDGNWNSSLNVNYSQTLDSLDRINFKTNSSIFYNNSVDYTSERGGQTVEPYRSSVHNLTFSEEIATTYSIKKTRLQLHGKVDWNNLTSRRENFNKMNTFDFSYGLSFISPLIWGFDVSTDLNMHSRRGYSDKNMNDNNLVWNAELSRSFLKGKNLILKLDGFDILGQLDNVLSDVNAQGRTETWYNTVPRYAMLHLIYRLNIQPKKKKD